MIYKKLYILVPFLSKKQRFPDLYLRKIKSIQIWELVCNHLAKKYGKESIVIATDIDDICILADRIGYHVRKTKSCSNFYDLLLLYPESAILIVSPYFPLLSFHDIDFIVENSWPEGAIIEAISSTSIDDNNPVFIYRSEVKEIDINFRRKIYYKISENYLEIRNVRDCWILEKLEFQKRIVFYTAGYNEIGFGHIYRSLMLAMELKDHDIVFVVDQKSELAAIKLIEPHGFPISLLRNNNPINDIILLNPAMVILDILDTESLFVSTLKAHGIRVVSFEDLGTGAHYTDLTINELFDYPLFEGSNILWGHNYYFLRSEFYKAHRNKEASIKTVILTFGGTDQNDFTRKILNAIYPYCFSKNIKIIVVVGPGYIYSNLLEKERKIYNKKIVKIYFKTSVISSLMEISQLAICSNGRTVYELAQLNIPSIVLCHHEREATHTFSNEDNGFINLGTYKEGKTESEVLAVLKNLAENPKYYQNLLMKMKKHDFSKNLEKVVHILKDILGEKHV